MKQIRFKKRLETGLPRDLASFLQQQTGLPKMRIKDALQKGAVWRTAPSGKRRRVRRATTVVKKGDLVELYYDLRVLSRKCPSSLLQQDLGDYSVWYKPGGVMTQGNDYGDHCSLLRQVELAFPCRRKVFPVNRLDYETSGLVLVAHTRMAAGKLSKMFQERLVTKTYQAVVRGNPGLEGAGGTINSPLDGKEAVTHFKVIRYDPETDTALVRVWIDTGRTHQIRRHFAQQGYPVMGDPRYGTGNKNKNGLQLIATSLAFMCPFAHTRNVFQLTPQTEQKTPQD